MDEDGGVDAGSDCSYESVASEGGYQPAAERGRDASSRIVTSSYCVEVFRHLSWANQSFCGQEKSSNSKENNSGQGKKQKEKKGGGPSATDPFAELPGQMLRFDGAMEAWLEELPVPREMRRRFIPYTELGDAAEMYSSLSILKEGNRRAVVWYFNQNFLLQLWPFFFLPNSADVWVKMLIDNQCTITATHIPLGEIHCPKDLKRKALDSWLNEVFAALQTSKWTPDGEARKLLSSKSLTHAAMAVGDVIQVGSQLYAAGLSGFVKIREASAILPRRDLDEDAEESVDESDDDFPSHSPPKSEREKPEKGNSKGQNNNQKPDKAQKNKQAQKDDKVQKSEKGQQSKGSKGNGKVGKPQQAKKQQKRKGEEGAKGPPKDRRGLRAELQRLRNEHA